MSKLFYDHLIILEEVEDEIKAVAETPEEREELWQLVDEIIHHRVLGCILDKLPHEYHDGFLNKFHETPHSEGLIIYLNDKLDVEDDIEEVILEEIGSLKEEILEEIRE